LCTRWCIHARCNWLQCSQRTTSLAITKSFLDFKFSLLEDIPEIELGSLAVSVHIMRQGFWSDVFGKVNVLAAAAAVAAALMFSIAVGALFVIHDSTGTSDVSLKLSHTLLSVRASSLAHVGEADANAHHLQDTIAAIAASSSASFEQEERDLSDNLFHKSKFASFGSLAAASSFSSRHFSTRSLGAQRGDMQYFVHFSTRSDVRTLVALQKFTAGRVVAHVEGGLYVVIGGVGFSAMARRFPGVAWVQEREAASKIGKALQLRLKKKDSFMEDRGDINSRSSGIGSIEIVAECWFEGCRAAALAVTPVCGDVYLHPTLVEVHCPADAVHTAVSVLSEHTGVDFVDVKTVAFGMNYGGRAIIGSGPDAASPDASRVLSDIDVSGSIIAIADSGIDMNNCFFYDAAASHPPWNNSRVVQSYVVQPCELCGRCCGALKAPNCTNQLNTCGNFIDEASHGTHVACTVAGIDPAGLTYGKGIASGARIFFQDIENILSESQCYNNAPDSCGKKNSPPTDLFNLFKPAYDVGARVHCNSWGPGSGDYSMDARAVDAFTFSHPTFLVLLAAGNEGEKDVLGTVGSTSTCKNCLVVGATQQSEALFRSMSPYVDDGHFCSTFAALDSCCMNPLNCVQRCCPVLSKVNSSLPCCANQTTCGNSGTCSVESGNLRSARNVASFSGRGPTPDGRIKPDLVAPGEDILSAATPEQIVPGKFTPTSPNHCAVPSNQKPRSVQENLDRAFQLTSGTSMAVPLVAGAAEKIRQYFVQGYYPQGSRRSGRSFEPEEALIRAVLLASCVGVFSDKQAWGVWSQSNPSISGFFRFPIPPEAAPNFFQGFGLPVLDNAVYMAGSTTGHRMLYTNGSFSPSSSASAFKISCDSSKPVPLTLALVWTDPPGSIYSDKQLVNDLDLIVLQSGSNPSQVFGNMRFFADQANTVERVVTQCPVAGFVTAVVAPGNPPKTASQDWYLVANGPISTIDNLSPVPSYSTGRAARPLAQSQSCILDPGITASVRFKPSRVWSCETSIGLWNCVEKRRAVVTSLAQALGVAVQGFGRTSSNSTGMSMTLHCSVMIGALGSESAALFQYVTAMTLQNHIYSSCSAAASVCNTDSVLSAFDWSTFAMGASATPAGAQMTMSIASYDDKDCTKMSSSFLSAPNPLVFTDQACVPGFVLSGKLLWVKATSCDSNSSFQISFNSEKACAKDVLASQMNGLCGQIPEISSFAPSTWLKFTCSSTSISSCKYPKLCLLIPDSAFYAIIALFLLHLTQAVAWTVISKRKLMFSIADFVIILLLPVFGLVKWLPVCRPSVSSDAAQKFLKSRRSTGDERGGTLLAEINPT
jgi:subtilisin family serine protease